MDPEFEGYLQFLSAEKENLFKRGAINGMEDVEEVFDALELVTMAMSPLIAKLGALKEWLMLIYTIYSAGPNYDSSHFENIISGLEVSHTYLLQFHCIESDILSRTRQMLSDLKKQALAFGIIAEAGLLSPMQHPLSSQPPAFPHQPSSLIKPSSELILTLAPDITLELVRVPAGEFLMGSDWGKGMLPYETPRHKLYLPEYLIGKHPVTVAQFAAFVKASGYKTTAEVEGNGFISTHNTWNVKGANWQQPRGPGSDVNQKAGHPVTLVSRNDAVAYCAWAGQVSGREVRLPSEAEWEKAARGTDGRIYPWGNQAPDNSYCNYNMNVKDTTPVGKYSPTGDSPYGCTDMAGNVWEWTNSLLKNYPLNAKDGREDQEDRDVREDYQEDRDYDLVIRGGAFFTGGPDFVRCAFRSWYDSLDRIDGYGFRVWVSPISNSGL